MFFILSKLLTWLIMPFSQILILLLLWLFVKHKIWKRRSKIAFLSLFLFYTNPFLSWFALNTWEVPATPFSEITKNCDYGIVLGGVSNMLTLPQDRIHFNQSADRITDAIQLYKTGKIKQLIMSGGSGSLTHRELKESTRVKDYLLAIGIPSEDIIAEDQSDNTYQNAVNTMELVQKLNANASTLLITSSTHMRRAAGCFEKAGLNPDIFSADIQTSPMEFSFGLFIPSIGAISTWSALIKEWIGYTVYWMVGYL